jgi:hypothetical protein
MEQVFKSYLCRAIIPLSPRAEQTTPVVDKSAKFAAELVGAVFCAPFLRYVLLCI